jgi:hypothetical protein
MTTTPQRTRITRVHDKKGEKKNRKNRNKYCKITFMEMVPTSARSIFLMDVCNLRSSLITRVRRASPLQQPGSQNYSIRIRYSMNFGYRVFVFEYCFRIRIEPTITTR